MRSETAEQSASAQRLLSFFGVCGVCYTFAVDYRKQTVAMIKQNIKKYYELEGLEGRHRSISNLHEKNHRRIV